MTTSLTSSTSFSIPDFKVGYLQAKLEKLNKRARKLSLPPLKIHADFNSPSSIKSVPSPTMSSRKIDIPMFDVTIEGVVPVLNGWTVVAAIDLEDDMTIIRSYLDRPIPDSYKHELRGHCEHCETSRRRKKMVILQDESSNLIQVGRSCLKDFLSSSVENELRLAESIAELYAEMDTFDPDEMLAMCSPGDLRTTTQRAFETAAACIRSEGFVPSSSEDRMPTKVLMELALFGANGLSVEMMDLIHSLEVTEEDTETALNCIDWIMESDSKTDFMFNLNQIVTNELAKVRLFGFIGGAVGSYLKQAAKAKEEKQSPYADGHLGNIKQRIVVKSATIMGRRLIDSFYGTSTMWTLKDEDDHCIVWFSTNGADLGDEGSKISFKGTVKAHNEYRGTKQTVMNRLSPL